MAVGPDKTEELKLEEYHPEDTEYELTNLDDDQVALISKENQITPALQEVFRKVLAQKNEVSNFEAQIKARQTEITAITQDQARVRENMKVLKGSPEEKALLQRYTHQLDSQEDRLVALNQRNLRPAAEAGKSGSGFGSDGREHHDGRKDLASASAHVGTVFDPSLHGQSPQVVVAIAAGNFYFHPE